ncbi:S8 family serine peptidase [Fusibacter bizertensis]
MKKLNLALLLVIVIALVGCSSANGADEKEEKSISRVPSPIDYSEYFGKVESLPQYDEHSEGEWKVDIRSSDLTALDLKDRLNDLLHSDFDSDTKWPKTLPKEFDPKKIMKLGEDPGLNVKTLHEKGITGKGVGVAIIDQTLLVDHKEYADQLKFYEEINIPEDQVAMMHGSAVSSIAVGKTIGVAPKADLYYIAETHGTYSDADFEYDFTYLASAIDRILEINKDLPSDKKIRVISISVGWNSEQKGFKEVTESVEKAKKEGIFVVSSSLSDTYGYRFSGLGRNALDDPNAFESYRPGEFWASRFYDGYISLGENTLLVPMDSRCTASPTGQEDYVFYSTGGWSWSIPYIAGLYALACEVDPSITPDVFWENALATGTRTTIEKNGKTFDLGIIVDPVKLIDSLDKK